jgi:hypothetical protein
VRFSPWIGDQFQSGLRGLRLLIVGESHYGPKNQNYDPGFTVNCVRNVVRGEWKLKFFGNLQSNLADAGLGVESPTCLRARKEFWERVAFYNYIQEMISAPGIAPSTSAWERAREPFREVLNELQPNCVLFACKRLYLAATDRFEAVAPLSVEGMERGAVLVPYDGGNGVGSFILHPSYRGYRKQRVWIAALLERAFINADKSIS